MPLQEPGLQGPLDPILEAISSFFKGFDGPSADQISNEASINGNPITLEAAKQYAKAGSDFGPAQAIVVPAYRLKSLSEIVDAKNTFKEAREAGASFDAANRKMYSEHGVYTNKADKLLRAVLDDTGAYVDFDATDFLLKNKAGQSLPLTSVLNHPELFNKFPELKKVSVEKGDIPGAAAYYKANKKLLGLGSGTLEGNDLVSSILHEVTHAIQRETGYPAGTNTDSTFLDIVSRLNSYIDKGKLSVDQVGSFLDTEHADKLAVKGYYKTVGEHDARVTQSMFEENRLAQYLKNLEVSAPDHVEFPPSLDTKTDYNILSLPSDFDRDVTNSKYLEFLAKTKAIK
jgi:hypothetical protein